MLLILWCKLFQSTHPLGVRPKFEKLASIGSKFQSTHPLGVRQSEIQFYCIDTSFNPRTHSGCDYVNQMAIHIGYLFQSTHPLGVRRCAFFFKDGVKLVSIHAPTRGATASRLTVNILVASFNPRTHSGCDKVLDY